MPRTVHERTAEWAKEAERHERGDYVQVLAWMLLAGLSFMSATDREFGWIWLASAAFMLVVLWRVRRGHRRRADAVAARHVGQ